MTSKVTLDLSGGDIYFIELNDETYITSDNQITLDLGETENILKVKTNLDCQGTYNETIVLSSEVFVYPNPISDGRLNIYLGSLISQDVDIAIFRIDGTQVFKKPQKSNQGYVNMNISGLAQGVYLLNIKTNDALLNYKIIKK